ncbi:Flagellar hook-associated protein 2 [Planctomycetes bacterium MalM25]|nr:Flagellar hook-associated protein 2 [Planctomycetes bacterium MalM25]
MSRISSTGISTSAGLVSGIPIQDTVDQLMALSARPRDLLINRTGGLQAERTAVDRLSSLVLGFQFSLNSLSSASAFSGRSATSSSEAVSVSIPSGENPALGSYTFTPLKSAASHQVVSGGVTNLSDSLGTGTLRIRNGGQVDKGVSLSQLNGGSGFQPGRIRLTDRDGATATIDLRAATTVDDVLYEINQNDDVAITASTSGDQFVLTDTSGGAGTLAVEDLSGGSSATSLGLTGVSAVGDTLTGADVFGLTTSTSLASLNDGRGVDANGTAVTDLKVTARDGTTAEIELDGLSTLGEVIDAINNNETLDGKVEVAIAADGSRLEVTDTFGGSGNLTIENAQTVDSLISSAVDDLGLAIDVASNSATGGRLVSGLSDTLLSSLNGGSGIDAASIDITDRDGDAATVDLSTAETLGEVIDAINAAGIDLTAAYNDSRSGIVIEATGSGTGSLTIAENGGTTGADLGILVDDTVASIDSGTLNRATVAGSTRLSDLNGGEGVSLGRIRITGSDGGTSDIDLRFTGQDEPTLGDVIRSINLRTGDTGVEASLNATGDGLLLTDTAGGSGTLTVSELSGGSTAEGLRILGASTTTNESDQQTIDGTTSFALDLAELSGSGADTPLSALNDGEGVAAGVIQIQDSSYDEDAGTGEAFIDLTGAETLQDVIDAINASAEVSVNAELNDNGNGIKITDEAGGAGDLVIDNLGASGTTASDLGIEGTFSTTNSEGEIVANGSAVLTTDGGLEQLAQRINNLDAGITAAVVFDGFGYRLSIASDQTGSPNELLIDDSEVSLSFTQTSRPSDAVALYGTEGQGGFTVVSQDGTYNEIVDGLDISVNQATGEAVTLDVVSDDDGLFESIQSFVDSYNSLRDNLDAVTEFDAEAETTGILFGRNEANRVDTELGRVLSGRFTFGTNYTSLESVGISLDRDGKLSLDESKLRDALTDDRTAVEDLFSNEDRGVVAQVTAVTERLAGDNSLLSSRSEALADTIEINNQRVSDFNDRLDRERETLLLQFIQLEETIALLQSNTSFLSGIVPVTSSGSSNQ